MFDEALVYKVKIWRHELTCAYPNEGIDLGWGYGDRGREGELHLRRGGTEGERREQKENLNF